MTSQSERFDPDTSYPTYSRDKTLHSNIGKALSLTLLIVSSLTASVTALAEETHDLVIVNGRVMDPETGLDGVRNVGIRDGKIVTITEESIKGKETIDATGHVVAPGFIDTHVHVVDIPFGYLSNVLSGVQDR